MEPEDQVMRLAYFILFITLALMTWAVSVQAEASPLLSTNPLHSKMHQSNGFEDDSPCSFNLLCSCSKPGPSEFGIVACHNIPFANVPLVLNSSRAFMLSMVGNNLQVLEEKRLMGAGLWRLEIQNNNLYYIADDAFIGLTKFLTELDLQNNELTTIPTVAIRRLSKLRLLNLSGNEITDVLPDDFEGLPATINCVSLAANMITNIPEGAFANLPKLERLDLSGNSIQLVNSQAFLVVSRSLSHLYMSQNLLQKIPFEALSILKLKYLDLSHNLLTSTLDIFYQGKLLVTAVSFDYNRINALPPFAFKNFKQVNTVSLAYNPISVLVDDVFKDGNINDLDLSNCYIQEVHPRAFRGLEYSLDRLDLSFNNITFLPADLFEHFDHLRHINLDENRLQVDPDEFVDFRYALHRFSLVGDSIAPIGMEDIRVMRNLRSLNMSNFGLVALTPKVFEEFGLAIEDLKISQAKVTSIMASAFLHLTGLKNLDLSDNKIGRIEDGAFDEVGHSIVRLKLSNSIRMNSISPAVFHRLTAVKELDLSGNSLNSLAENTFDKNHQLTHLNLRFNKISSLGKKLFDPVKTPRLEHLALSFNTIKDVKESTFSRLKELEILELNENSIQNIQKKAFEDLTSLKILNLAGNKITQLVDEAFQNLPRLQVLNLANNQITSFNIDAFEQLGTLSSFRIDLSHNNIQRLGPEVTQTPHHTFTQKPGKTPAKPSNTQQQESSEDSEESSSKPTSLPVFSISSSSIESLDLSDNNISYITPHFFAPISNTLIDLDLSHNKLSNLTKEHISGMRFIQHLKLQHNVLDTIEYDTFRESKLIQVINLDNNVLRDLPPDLFEECVNLRVFSARHNKIRSIVDTLFKDTNIEILNMESNQIVRFPEAALSRIASSVVKLDLSGNEISSMAPNQIECLQRLRWLSLANNRIVVIAENTFDNLYSLLHVDLSGNPLGRISSRLFEEAKNSLLHLHLANMSLDVLPEFDTFTKLLTFNASFNSLTYLPTNFGVNVSNLRTLDVSGNEISAPPNTIWHTIPRLSTIIMHSNPIKLLANDSFLQLERLHELDISNLPLESVQVGMLYPVSCLKELKMGPLRNVVNAGAVIQNADSLQHLHLKVDSPMMSNELRLFEVPEKLSKITISGLNLLSISDGAFKGVRSRYVQLVLQDTGLADLGEGVVQSLGEATDVSLEIQGNNSVLKSIGNPSSQFKPEPFVTYLRDLEVDEEFSIACSCDAGWIEFWLRQWMQRMCPVVPQSETSSRCDSKLKSFRNVKCVDKPGSGLLDAFVNDLECGWDSSASTFQKQHFKTTILLASVAFTLFNAFATN